MFSVEHVVSNDVVRNLFESSGVKMYRLVVLTWLSVYILFRV